MVTVKQFEDDYYLWKQNSGSELSKSPWLPLSGIKIPLYVFGSQPVKGNCAYDGLTCAAEEELSLLDSLLLAQWEDKAWKGLLKYDVTACETKVITGQRKFVAQLNEAWKSKELAKFDENKALQQLDPFRFSCKKTLREELLFCVASGQKGKSELIMTSTVPNDAGLIIFNENPVEYGHVFLVPHNLHHLSQSLDVRSLEMVTQVAVEINNGSFRVFCDCPASSCANDPFFQGCYFANPLPVELMPILPISGEWEKRGMHIGEIIEYPMKVLLFECKDCLKMMVELVSEICSHLQDQSMSFNLLLSDCGTKIFLFTQVSTPVTGYNLSSWECSGHFVFGGRCDFEQATEEALAKRLSAVSLGEERFQSVKQLCCCVASKKFVC